MTATKRNTVLAGAGGLILALATACSSSGSSGKAASGGTSPGTGSTTTQSAPTGQPATITIASFTFTGPLTVSPGTTVTVTNTDSADHTVTADSAGDFDVQAPGGKTVTFTAPTTPGTYPFHCAIHPQMHGTLIVK
jgi:plastocyanin